MLHFNSKAQHKSELQQLSTWWQWSNVYEHLQINKWTVWNYFYKQSLQAKQYVRTAPSLLTHYIQLLNHNLLWCWGLYHNSIVHLSHYSVKQKYTNIFGKKKMKKQSHNALQKHGHLEAAVGGLEEASQGEGVSLILSPSERDNYREMLGFWVAALGSRHSRGVGAWGHYRYTHKDTHTHTSLFPVHTNSSQRFATWALETQPHAVGFRLMPRLSFLK